MSTQVTRAVRFLSTVHGTTAAVRAGEKTVDDVAKATIFSPKYFPKFLIFTCTVSGMVGFQYMDARRKNHQRMHKNVSE